MAHAELRGFVLASALLTVCGSANAGEEVNIYSRERPELIRPVLDSFSRKTGIEAHVLYLPRGLTARMSAEAENSPADVILTDGIDRLQKASDEGVTQPAPPETLNLHVPTGFHDEAGQWFAIASREQHMLASSERVSARQIRYQALVAEHWKGRICAVNSGGRELTGLVSWIIARDGAKAAEQWLSALRPNLAADPGERTTSEQIGSGLCDLAFADETVTPSPMVTETLLLEDQSGGGPSKIYGMALARFAPNKKNAVRLMEFLSSPDGQALYAAAVSGTPVRRQFINAGKTKLRGIKGFLEIAPADSARHLPAAEKLIDRIVFDRPASD